MQDETLVGSLDDYCAPPPPAGADDMDASSCSAGHTLAYISPYGDVYPWVQFRLPCGNVRRHKFIDIWRNSPQLAEFRSIPARELPVCSSCRHVATCTRWPVVA